MEWTSLNELREKFLSFYESKGHLRMPSFSLIPNNDNSLLLINSGMAPMKKYFTGEITPPRKRVTTCQKCIRTPDIESVGKTDRHGTYFEMLGNFSFGDYFKHEATAWAWEFCTEVIKMPKDKIWITIYENDDEAFEIWTKEVGVSPDRIVRLGKEDNFWEHGSGPCGPCSELHFDRGEKYGCGKPDCGPGCECDRYVEFWNNVFTQFENDGNGNYTPLEHPNIDTGMGLERLACIMQGVDNIFEVDTVQNIMNEICNISGVKYHTDKKTDVSLRVITDHIRSSTFMIGDGVIPSNNGRGYVLRRLIRRACRHGRMLGIKEPFLYKVCDTVIKENLTAYAYLEEKKEIIKKVLLSEEESFDKTIDAGLELLNKFISETDGTVFSGDDAFKLNDTYGFPLDLTKDVLEEKGMTVDEERFYELLENQKQTARSARKASDTDAWKDGSIRLDCSATEFLGYSENKTEAKIVAIISNGELKDVIGEGEKASLILDKTVLYAESGGQVGDSGVISNGIVEFEVADTKKNAQGVFMHNGVSNGVISVGDIVTVSYDVEKRNNIKRNHTAAHLLQAALRKVLGTHVEQAGQLVNENEVRFDFTHFNAMTQEEIEQTENLVNEFVLSAKCVENKEMPIEEAKKLGAMALFGEKYGDVVRVVIADDFSVEFCGGTHVSNSGEIGLFKIISETSVAAGVRRITAITGKNVLNYINKNNNIIFAACAFAKAGSADELDAKIEAMAKESKSKDKEIEALNSEIAKIKSADLFSKPLEIDGLQIYTAKLEGVAPNSLGEMGDKLKEKGDNVVGVIAGINGEKANIIAVCGKTAIEKGVKAGNLVKEIAKIAGGGGGGKPDRAMAGAKDISKLDDAINAVADTVKSFIG